MPRQYDRDVAWERQRSDTLVRLLAQRHKAIMKGKSRLPPLRFRNRFADNDQYYRVLDKQTSLHYAKETDPNKAAIFERCAASAFARTSTSKISSYEKQLDEMVAAMTLRSENKNGDERSSTEILRNAIRADATSQSSQMVEPDSIIAISDDEVPDSVDRIKTEAKEAVNKDHSSKQNVKIECEVQ